jgi:carboxyl-terminal processing protease
VAGALQDSKRAVVIGTQTFGKGSVQTIMPLGNNTAIKLTTARYYTPSGRSIQALGITPDVVVEDPSDTAIRVREADLQRHLENGKAEAKKDADHGKEPTPRARTVPAPTPAELKPIDFGGKDDFQLQQAVAYLKGEPVKSQAPTVAQSTKTN